MRVVVFMYRLCQDRVELVDVAGKVLARVRRSDDLDADLRLATAQLAADVVVSNTVIAEA